MSIVHDTVEIEAGQCADSARRCQDACLEAAMRWGIRTAGTRGDASHLGLLLDCANACAMAADFLHRGSDYANYPCGICAWLCEHCARSCEHLGGDGDIAAVVERLHECADRCLRLSKSPHWRHAHSA